MPRYFFHITDGAEFPDDEGTVLARGRAEELEIVLARTSRPIRLAVAIAAIRASAKATSSK
jgi:hypothetical protein